MSCSVCLGIGRCPVCAPLGDDEPPRSAAARTADARAEALHRTGRRPRPWAGPVLTDLRAEVQAID